jgi:hypothetical protein
MTRGLLLACLLMLAAESAPGADAYGPLFMSPGQRAQLDERFDNRGVATFETAENGSTGSPDARPLTVNGTLVSNTGKREVWINGEQQPRTTAGNGAQVHVLGSGQVRVKLSSTGAAHTLKPGQVLDRETGSISEAYDRTPGPGSGP